ncbi:MAG TPA: MFS transporter [Candidatus Dormibacteraeota bacterium]|nr:MFS transporter [Candidatus Dormibacteraeota bacterium]
MIHIAEQRPSSAPLPGMNRVLVLLSLSVLINYIDRSNLSIAAPLLQGELAISNTQLGTLLSAFFWTYALMQIPAGWLVDRFDVKWVFSVGFFVWSAATGVTGLLHGFAALLGIRVILGIGESVAFPSYSKILGGHFQEEHRGFANALLLAGLALGPAIGMLIGGRVVGRFGWRPFFLTLGVAGLLWLVPWWAWMPQRTSPSRLSGPFFAGFLQILRQRSLWGTCLGQASVNYYLYFLVTWLPSYLVQGRHLSMNVMARDGGLLFSMYAVGTTISGKLSDRWIQAGSSPTVVRKGTMAFGCTAFGVSLALLALSPEPLFTWMLVPTGLLLGISCCATWAIPQTLAGPEMVGRWTGMQNFIGNLGGAVAPVLTGYLLDRTGRFYWPFFITAGFAWIGALCWAFIVGPIEQVNWEASARKTRATPLRPSAESSRP